MSALTAVVLTHNESIHIARCLESLKGLVDDVVVVDSFSSDDTVDIARAMGARVYQNPWVNYAVQFQWALDHGEISTPWVMRIDADEYVEDGLRRELLSRLAAAPADLSGLYVRRKYVFLGRWIKYGAMYPIMVLRVWRAGLGRIEQRWMDEHIVLESGRSEVLEGNIVDDNHNNVGWWVAKHNGYATREMLDLLNVKYGFLPQDDQLQRQEDPQAKRKRQLKEQVYSKLPLFVRPLLYFIYRYVIKRGFLDGQKGFAFHFMQGLWYRALVDLKVLEAEEWIKDCRSPDDIRRVLAERTGLKL